MYFGILGSGQANTLQLINLNVRNRCFQGVFEPKAVEVGDG